MKEKRKKEAAELKAAQARCVIMFPAVDVFANSYEKGRTMLISLFFLFVLHDADPHTQLVLSSAVVSRSKTNDTLTWTF